MRSMRIKILYEDEQVTLQRLTITVGTCRMYKFRQVSKIDGELDVKEVKEPPLWYLRWLKLNQIGL